MGLQQTCEAGGVDHPSASRTASVISTGSADRRHGRDPAATTGGMPVGTHGFPAAATINSVSRTALAISAATIQGSPAAGGVGVMAIIGWNARRGRGPTRTARSLSCHGLLG